MAEAFKKNTVSIERGEARQYTIQSNRRLKIQSKEDMRPSDKLAQATRSSPDEADALAMTFSPIGKSRLWIW